MATNKELPQGYLDVVPTPTKLTVNNLVNFAEPEGAYGETDRWLKRLGYSSLIILLQLFITSMTSRLMGSLWYMFLLVPLTLPFALRVISLVVFHEKRVMKDYDRYKDRGSTLSYKDMFSVYDMSKRHPYFIYFNDGSIGLALQLVRRTQVGEAQKKAFNHAEVLSQFYNLASQFNIRVSSIDIQASNTKDDRFDLLYRHLSTVKNPIIEQIMGSMYSHLEANSDKSALSYEYFIIYSFDVENTFWENASVLISNLQGQGYKRVNILNEAKLSELTKALFGLHEFPIREAMRNVASIGNTSLKLLWVGDKNGKRKYINGAPIVGVSAEDAQNGSDLPSQSTAVSVSEDVNARVDLFAENDQSQVLIDDEVEELSMTEAVNNPQLNSQRLTADEDKTEIHHSNDKLGLFD